MEVRRMCKRRYEWVKNMGVFGVWWMYRFKAWLCGYFASDVFA